MIVGFLDLYKSHMNLQKSISDLGFKYSIPRFLYTILTDGFLGVIVGMVAGDPSSLDAAEAFIALRL